MYIHLHMKLRFTNTESFSASKTHSVELDLRVMRNIMYFYDNVQFSKYKKEQNKRDKVFPEGYEGLNDGDEGP